MSSKCLFSAFLLGWFKTRTEVPNWVAEALQEAGIAIDFS